jgi:NADH-quinone oxidoreductase subunit H
MATVAALATTLFLGGWHAPWPISQIWEGSNEGYWPLLWFFGKVLAFIFFFIWLRGTLPRLRYDQFMHFGWKRLIPISLLWIVAVATVRAITLDDGLDRRQLLIGIGVLAALFLVLFLVPERKGEPEAEALEPGEPTTGGYPVPPMPAGGAVRGAAEPLVFREEI